MIRARDAFTFEGHIDIGHADTNGLVRAGSSLSTMMVIGS